MSTTRDLPMLSGSLEDYLETIFELLRDQRVARVKEIAKARGVRAGSVSPAMHRLRDLGLIEYVQREYITLTPAGERQARRVLAKHQLLTRFFHDVLGVPEAQAQVDACAAEHALSPSGMDHLARFLEFVRNCPEGEQLIHRFRHCALVQDGAAQCVHKCPSQGVLWTSQGATRSIADLQPGEQGVVAHVGASGAVRQRLLDMGVLPDVTIELERVAPAGDPVWIRLHGFQLSLRRKEAQAVLLTASGTTSSVRQRAHP